jgi:hypothetical protein
MRHLVLASATSRSAAIASMVSMLEETANAHQAAASRRCLIHKDYHGQLAWYQLLLLYSS